MQKSRLWSTVALGSSFLAIVACGAIGGGPAALGTPAGAGSATAKPLVVGAILSTTGGAGVYGSDTDKGARLAVEQVNARPGGARIKYVLMDDKSDKTEASKVARALLDLEKANVLLGPAISPSALSVAPLAEERQVPMIATSATQDDITRGAQGPRDYVFRVCFNDGYQGRAAAAFAATSLGKKKAAVVFDKSLSYSIGLANAFREEFGRLGGTVIAEENYSAKDTDFSALIAKVAGFDAELLFIPGWAEQVGPMLKQAGRMWDKFVLLGGDGWPTNRLLELAAGNVGNSYAIAHYAPEDPDPLSVAFRAAYRGKYGEDPSPFAALGYDTVLLIADAARRAASPTGADLQAALASTRGLKLVTGTFTSQSDHNPTKDVVIVRLKPDRIAFHERLRLQP